MYQVKDGGREWTGRFVSQAHAESRGEGGGGRVSSAMEEAGNSLPRNFSYRAVGPPPGRTSPPAYVAEWAGTRVSTEVRF